MNRVILIALTSAAGCVLCSTAQAREAVYVAQRVVGATYAEPGDSLPPPVAELRRGPGRVALLQLRAQVEAAGGLALGEECPFELIGQRATAAGEKNVYQVTAQVIYIAETPLPDSWPVGAKRTAAVRVTLRARDGSRTTTGDNVTVTLPELASMVRNPAGAKYHTVGALLRRSWEQALEGEADDTERFEAVVSYWIGRGLHHGESGRVSLGGDVSPDDADRLLNRARAERERDGEGRPPVTLAPGRAELLESALEASLWASPGDSIWERLVAARRRGASGPEDEAFLREFIRYYQGTRARSEARRRSVAVGATGRLGPLGE